MEKESETSNHVTSPKDQTLNFMKHMLLTLKEDQDKIDNYSRRQKKRGKKEKENKKWATTSAGNERLRTWGGGQTLMYGDRVGGVKDEHELWMLKKQHELEKAREEEEYGWQRKVKLSDTDISDAYFSSFEDKKQKAEIKLEEWSQRLKSLLTGKALTAYSSNVPVEGRTTTRI